MRRGKRGRALLRPLRLHGHGRGSELACAQAGRPSQFFDVSLRQGLASKMCRASIPSRIPLGRDLMVIQIFVCRRTMRSSAVSKSSPCNNGERTDVATAPSLVLPGDLTNRGDERRLRLRNALPTFLRPFKARGVHRHDRPFFLLLPKRERRCFLRPPDSGAQMADFSRGSGRDGSPTLISLTRRVESSS